MSILLQQLVLFTAFSLRIKLVYISTWVVYVPVVIIWVLYIVVPLLAPKKKKAHIPMLRAP